MYPSRRGCGRSHPTSGRREGPGRSLHFAGYINEWLTADIPTVLRSATALVPLKMETPVPFTGTWTDAEACLKEFY